MCISALRNTRQKYHQQAESVVKTIKENMCSGPQPLYIHLSVQQFEANEKPKADVKVFLNTYKLKQYA